MCKTPEKNREGNSTRLEILPLFRARMIQTSARSSHGRPRSRRARRRRRTRRARAGASSAAPTACGTSARSDAPSVPPPRRSTYRCSNVVRRRRRILPDRLDQASAGRRRRRPRSWTRFVYSRQFGHVGHEVDAEDAARREHARDRRERRRQVASAGAATAGCRTARSPSRTTRRPKRQRADVAADETRTRIGDLRCVRDWRAARRRAFEHRRRAIDADEIDAGARERQRDAAGAAAELEHAARRLRRDRAARTARRGARASARSPSRRTARTRPSLASLRASCQRMHRSGALGPRVEKGGVLRRSLCSRRRIIGGWTRSTGTATSSRSCREPST